MTVQYISPYIRKHIKSYNFWKNRHDWVFFIGVISDYMCRGYTFFCYSFRVLILEIFIPTLKGQKRDIHDDKIIKTVTEGTIKAPP